MPALFNQSEIKDEMSVTNNKENHDVMKFVSIECKNWALIRNSILQFNIKCNKKLFQIFYCDIYIFLKVYTIMSFYPAIGLFFVIINGLK
jgi:hypothetical protein